MRFNKDTERSIQLDDIANQCRAAVATKPSSHKQPSQVWDSRLGDWVPTGSDDQNDDNQSIQDDAVPELTIQLWGACNKLRQLAPGSLASATVQSLKRDVFDIIQELQRLS
jgi:hypothetical protein